MAKENKKPFRHINVAVETRVCEYKNKHLKNFKWEKIVAMGFRQAIKLKELQEEKRKREKEKKELADAPKIPIQDVSSKVSVPQKSDTVAIGKTIDSKPQKPKLGMAHDETNKQPKAQDPEYQRHVEKASQGL